MEKERGERERRKGGGGDVMVGVVVVMGNVCVCVPGLSGEFCHAQHNTPPANVPKTTVHPKCLPCSCLLSKHHQ